MGYYYDLLDQHTGETLYEPDESFDTIQDALVDAKRSLVKREAFWRVFTSPPGRPELEEPQVTSTISPDFESNIQMHDINMMIKIQTGIRDEVSDKSRTLTPDEIDFVILEVSGWDVNTEVGAELHAEAYAKVEDSGIHIYREESTVGDA